VLIRNDDGEPEALVPIVERAETTATSSTVGNTTATTSAARLRGFDKRRSGGHSASSLAV